MRVTFWLLALFGIAVAVALFAGNNQGTVTLFWPPWRVDLSLTTLADRALDRMRGEVRILWEP